MDISFIRLGVKLHNVCVDIRGEIKGEIIEIVPPYGARPYAADKKLIPDNETTRQEKTKTI
jgi:hypothetical protein